MSKLIYEKMTYKIIGLAYEVDNAIGYGQKEKVYADSFEELFKREKIAYIKEFYAPVKINDKIIAKRYFDFLVDDKIILEIKTGSDEYRKVCGQVFKYLKISKLRLGLVVRFTKIGVKIKRIPNIRQ